MTPREKFQRLLQISQKLREQHSAECKALQAEFEAECIRQYRMTHPRKRPTFAKLVKEHLSLVHGIKPPYQTRAERIIARHDGQWGRIKKALDSLAQQIPLKPSETVWSQWRTCSGGSHSTMGLSCHKYAKHDADSMAKIPAFYGIPVQVRWYNEKPRWGYSHFNPCGDYSCGGYHVWVAMDPEDLPILDRLPGPKISLREWMMECWKDGTNPRVYNPFLREGLEAELGIDYFGNDLRAQTARVGA